MGVGGLGLSTPTARRKLGKPIVCVRGAPRQPPRTQPRSPHHDRSVGPWGARTAETQKTNTQCYPTTSPSCIWPPSARRSSFCDLHSGCGHIGAQRSSLARFVVSSASLPRPRGYLRQSGFASTARRPGAHRCTGASRPEDDRLRAGKGNGKPIARPKGPPSGMSLSEKDTSASCPKARAARRCHNGCNCTVGSPKRRRANAVASGVNVSCGRLAASC